MYYLVSDFIEGQTVFDFMKESSDQPDKLDQAMTQINGKLKSYMDDIRKIPSQGYIGSLGEKHYEDTLFWPTGFEDLSIDSYGPFYIQQDMAKTMTERLAVAQDPMVMAWVAESLPILLEHDHPIVFTHNDLCAINIIVRCVNNDEYEVFIIDWEMAGFYPAYWEYCSAIRRALTHTPWLPMVGKIGQPYHAENLLIQYLRNLDFDAPYLKW